MLLIVNFKPEKKKPLPTLTHTVSTPMPSNGCETKAIKKYLTETQSQTDVLLTEERAEGTHQRTNPLIAVSSTNKMHLKKQHQEKQLTIMLVWISTLYLCGQIPMLFAYPNFVFKDTSKSSYKYYAVVVNLLELITYLANFFIYIRFTTQFQQVFRTKIKQMFSCSTSNTVTNMNMTNCSMFVFLC